MRILTVQIEDSKYGKLHPTEDAYLVREGVIVVADGITRDPLDLADFSGHSYESILQSYPNPSPALMAAVAFCKTFVDEAGSSAQVDLKSAAYAANQAIAHLNQDRSIDYLINDYAACVAAAVVIQGMRLYWMACGDCQVSVFDPSGKKNLTTPDGVQAWADYSSQLNFDWNKPEGRKFVRSQYRNRPDKVVDGQVVSYGAFTGEADVESFIMAGDYSLKVGDAVVCYSDGFAATVEHPEFLERLAGDKEEFEVWSRQLAEENYSRYGHERTIVTVWI